MHVLIEALAGYSTKLNKKGTTANELVTDTTVFSSLKASVLQLRRTADTAAVFVSNLKEVAANPRTPVGVLLHDEQAGASLKVTLNNLESSSKKLDKDLEALQHTFLMRRFFRNETKKSGK
jgi:phospholipid/cholesterol/gamma-HCH transport system substrate-binding protein